MGGCGREGPFNHVGPFTTAEARQAVRALNDDNQIWKPPTGVSDEGFEALWDDVRDYIQTYWDTNEPETYTGLTAFVLTTWIREELEFVPHLMLMGQTTGGKTRLLNTLARVSYRATVSASTTAAAVFRLIDKYDVSFYISEFHDLDQDAQRDIRAVLKAGQKRGETVTRAEPASTGYEPKVFDPFTHAAIATQFDLKDDTVNRCIQVHSSSPMDRDPPATFNEERAEGLRNRLQYVRYRLLNSDEWAAAEEAAYQYLAEKSIRGRTREKLLGPVTVAHIWDAVPRITPWVEQVDRQDRQAAAESEDALVVEAVRDLALDKATSVTTLEDGDPFKAVEISYTDVTERYEDMTGTEKSSAWLGHVVKRLDLEKERRRDGTVITDPDLGPKLRELCEDLNLEWKSLDSHQPVQELEDGDAVQRAHCSECGNDKVLTHRHAEEGHRMCRDCAEEYQTA